MTFLASSSIRLGFAAAALAIVPCLRSESAQPAAPAATAPETAAATTRPLAPQAAEKRAKGVLKDLKLDEEKQAAVRPFLEEQFQRIEAFHNAHAAELKQLWSEWSAARTPPHKDEAKAAEVGAKIDAVYAGFRPQHDAFLAALDKELSPAQVEAVKDSLTKKPGLERTYQAYLEMVPALTDAQKTWIHDKLAIARDEAMDATDDDKGQEKVNLFKKQKVQVEAYLDAQGYDYQKSYKAFVQKIKAEDAAKKAKAGE